MYALQLVTRISCKSHLYAATLLIIADRTRRTSFDYAINNMHLATVTSLTVLGRFLKVTIALD